MFLQLQTWIFSTPDQKFDWEMVVGVFIVPFLSVRPVVLLCLGSCFGIIIIIWISLTISGISMTFDARLISILPDVFLLLKPLENGTWGDTETTLHWSFPVSSLTSPSPPPPPPTHISYPAPHLFHPFRVQQNLYFYEVGYCFKKGREKNKRRRRKRRWLCCS